MFILPGYGVEDKHETAVHHVPLVPSQVVDYIRDELVVFDTDTSEQRLLPEAATTQDSRSCIDAAECKDTFDGARN